MYQHFQKYSILSPCKIRKINTYLIGYVVLIIIILPQNLLAQKKTFDMRNYRIVLDLSDLASKSISANLSLRFQSLQDISAIDLSLKGLTVDSVVYHGALISFTLLDENLTISFPGKIKKGTVDSLLVFYHGQPVKDPSWGGVYFSNAGKGYVFNMGVGFSDYPHNYGRVWFPCVDNFTDKATYSYEILTSPGKSALCSGNFIDSFISENKIHWIYRQDKPIATYLSSFAVGAYSLLHFPDLPGRQIQALSGVLPADTGKFKSSFRHLGTCLDIFEKYYLPYQFSRIGFVVVPFSSGAMEHAVNIAYPGYAVNGNLAYESLMAHEFSHHWFGNLVTCRTDSDMWLNEGWAVYSEYLFSEKIYGREAYLSVVKKNHKAVLQYAHIRDEDVYPVSPVPPEVTYGSTVYDKGADVVYCLRSYLGDSLFFKGIHQYLDSLKFNNATSYDLRNILSSVTKINLTSFFEDWVFRKGFPHFYIDEFTRLEGNRVRTGISNNPRFNNEIYHNVPLEIRFFSEKMEVFTADISLSGHDADFEFNLPFTPAFALIDPASKIPDARTFNLLTLNQTGKFDLPDGLMTVDVKSLKDSALIAVIHHWNGAEYRLCDGYRLSDYRYWTVKGVFPDGFDADASVQYDGRQVNNFNGNSYLDHTLNIENEDSLALMYRPDPQTPWQEYPDYRLVTGSVFNKKGSINIHHLKAGDYCLAVRDYTESTGFMPATIKLRVYPNPVNHDDLHIEFPNPQGMTYISLIDSNGKVLWFKTVSPVKTYTINKNLLQSNVCFVVAGNKNVKFAAKIIRKDNP